MGSMMAKFKQWVTGDDLEHDIYAMESDFGMDAPMTSASMYHNNNEEDLMMIERPTSKRSRRNNLRVVEAEHPAPQGRASEVRVIEPVSFEESLEIVEYLRASKSVVLNLHHLDTAQSQRVVDFLSGATHAIDGHQQRIGDGVFIFTPHHVNIATEDHDVNYNNASGAFWK